MVTVDYSTDDGATWRPATGLFAPDGTGNVMITHPDTDGYVSVRIHADDSAGNAVDETVIRAYAVASGA